MKTLCPTWDQTLIFNVEIYDSLENIQRSPPSVIMELFDKDQMVSNNAVLEPLIVHPYLVEPLYTGPLKTQF